MARSARTAVKKGAHPQPDRLASYVKLFDTALGTLPGASRFLHPNQRLARLPLKVDVFALAKAVHAVGGDDDGNPLPVHMSEREARADAARKIAQKAASEVRKTCEINPGKSNPDAHLCENADLCNLAERVTRYPREMDRLAAAVLMPTEDIQKWGGVFDWNDGLLANSYAVPIELAIIRRKDLRPST